MNAPATSAQQSNFQRAERQAQVVLLKKIEELTLHLIEIEKAIDTLKKENKKQIAEIQD
ncbi:MAG: hypothetical protein J7527_03480 [Chitinophagaceae bacterium]|nr:hypothetical protein [Chitinophagaceae bacterium]